MREPILHRLLFRKAAPDTDRGASPARARHSSTWSDGSRSQRVAPVAAVAGHRQATDDGAFARMAGEQALAADPREHTREVRSRHLASSGCRRRNGTAHGPVYPAMLRAPEGGS